MHQSPNDRALVLFRTPLNRRRLALLRRVLPASASQFVRDVFFSRQILLSSRFRARNRVGTTQPARCARSQAKRGVVYLKPTVSRSLQGPTDGQCAREGGRDRVCLPNKKFDLCDATGSR